MQNLIRGLVVILTGLATTALAATDRPVVGPVPDWVQPAAAEIPQGPGTDAAVQLLLNDEQVRFSPTATETYFDSRIRIQTPQGLQAIGTIALAWQPDADVVTVHRLIVRRGSQVRDLLGSGDGFTVLRREDLLEQATLTGTLTAVLQPSDLQVGDIVEFAYTRRHADPVVPDKPDLQFASFNTPIQNVRFRAQWPKQMAIRWQLRDFKPELQESSAGGNQSIAFTLENPPPLLQPTGAPARYAAVRRVQLTAFQSWPEVSRRLAPLYVDAAKLAADSPLRAEIERIRKASTDPKERTAAALKLAQEQVRYVLLAMNQGALVPASADQTWQRRYGDCKAKTALLLGLLHELGIEAEPVAVNSSAGDGIDRLLPAISAFDHVLVRAQIAGKTYWLDGTRPADRNLDLLQVPDFGWGLPLNTHGSELVRIQPVALTEPQLLTEVNLDASGGVDTPARFQAQVVFRGDSALAVKLSLDNADATQRDQGMRNYWRGRFDALQLAKVASSFDERSGALTWTAEGTLRMEWDDNGFYEVNDMSVGFKADFARPEGTDAEAPYAVPYPEYSVDRISVTLPPGKPEFTTYGDNVDKTIAGWEYKRTARIQNAVFTAESSSRSLVPEIPAQDARAAEAGLREMYKKGLYIQKPQKPAADQMPSADELRSQAGKPLATAAEYRVRGNQMMARGLPELAAGEFTRAIELDPKSAATYIDRGQAREKLDRLEEALADYDSARKLDPKNAYALGYLGALSGKQGHFREAIELLSQALLVQDIAWVRGMRASAHMSLGEFEQALPDLEAACKADPANVNNYMMRAVALMQLHRPEAARTVAAEVLAARAGPADGVALAAFVYGAAGDPGKARSMLTEAITRNPSPELYVARAALPATDPELMTADLQQALRLDPGFAPALQQLMHLQAAQKKYPELVRTMDQLEAISPALIPPQLQLVRGEALARAGQTAAAEKAYAAARTIAKNSGELNNLCWSEATAGVALEDALRDCDASLAKENSTAAHVSRGLVLLRLKRYEEAIASYDAAIARQPRLAEALFGRGIGKLRLGRKAEGEADIAAARDIDSAVQSSFANYGVER